MLAPFAHSKRSLPGERQVKARWCGLFGRAMMTTSIPGLSEDVCSAAVVGDGGVRCSGVTRGRGAVALTS